LLDPSLPTPLRKALSQTNQDNTHDFHHPLQRITSRSGNYFNQIADTEDNRPTWAEKHGTQYDPLEHTRYGESGERSTNQNPIPNPLTKPLVITNKNDSHDFKMPYKDWNQIRRQQDEERAA
jgi:hypothetical protein